MPLPNEHVLLDYVDLYLTKRKPEWETNKSWLVSITQSLFSVDVINAIKKITDNVKAEIATAKHFDDWYQLIFKLRTKADEGHQLKSNTGTESLLCETMHAIASVIIDDLLKDPTTNTLLSDEIQRLTSLIKFYKEENKRCIKERQGKGTTENNEKIKELTLKLAYLGDEQAINKLRLYGMLSYLNQPSPNDIKASGLTYVGPLCLQRGYHTYNYQQNYQSDPSCRVFRSFDDFRHKSILTSMGDDIAKQNEYLHHQLPSATVSAATASASVSLAPEQMTETHNIVALAPRLSMSANTDSLSKSTTTLSVDTLTDKYVFLAYIDLYLTKRQPEWETKTSKLINKAQSLFSVDVINAIKKITDNVKAEIATAKHFDDWYQLIFKLRTKADEGHQLKSNTGTESLLCETMHAIASILIENLTKNPITNALVEDKMQELTNQIKYYKHENKRCIKERQGKGTTENNEKIKELTLQLAYLGNEQAINKLRLYGMLPYLSQPTPDDIKSSKLNYVGPLCLQRGYHTYNYQKNYQSDPSCGIYRSFDDFRNQAILTGVEMEVAKQQSAFKHAEQLAIERVALQRKITEITSSSLQTSSSPHVSCNDLPSLLAKPHEASLFLSSTIDNYSPAAAAAAPVETTAASTTSASTVGTSPSAVSPSPSASVATLGTFKPVLASPEALRATTSDKIDVEGPTSSTTRADTITTADNAGATNKTGTADKAAIAGPRKNRRGN